MKSSTIRTLFIVSLLSACVLLIAVLGLIGHYVIGDGATCSPTSCSTSSQPRNGLLEVFNIINGAGISWTYDTDTPEQLEESVKGNAMMLVVRVFIRKDTSGDEVYVRQTTTTSSFSLDQWLDIIVPYSRKGVKIILDTDEVVNPVLKLLKSKKDRITQPVLLHADVLSGPGGGNLQRIDISGFNDAVDELFKEAVFSLGWTTACCNELYTKQMMLDMLQKCSRIKQSISFVVNAQLLKNSWLSIRWLLEKSDEFTLTVTDFENTGDFSPTSRKNFSSYDLLWVHNDFDHSRIYYDLKAGREFDVLKLLLNSAGSPLHKFDVDMDASKITWAHAVNSQAKLKKTLEDKTILMLETDVLLRGQGTPNQTTTPVMAHPPDIDSDITLDQWLETVLLTDRGIKLDFKSLEAVHPALAILCGKRKRLHQPVWLNADVIVGINTNRTPINASEFLRIVDQIFPEVTLSLGWTTEWYNADSDEGYSKAMVEEMHQLCRGVRQPVTIPVRAAAAKRSWCHLQWLLDQSRGYTLTIWHALKDNLDQEDMNYVRRHSERARVYFDLPPRLMPDV